jgi:hypothetical protein
MYSPFARGGGSGARFDALTFVSVGKAGAVALDTATFAAFAAAFAMIVFDRTNSGIDAATSESLIAAAAAGGTSNDAGAGAGVDSDADADADAGT